MEKMLDISAAGQLQISLNFAVNWMLNQNSLYAPAIIHDSQQLSLHILSPMLNLEELINSSAFLAVFIKISTIGLEDGGTISPQEGDILHDNLPGHMEMFSQ